MIARRSITSGDIGTDEGRAEYVERAEFGKEILNRFAALLRAVMRPFAQRAGVSLDRLCRDARDP